MNPNFSGTPRRLGESSTTNSISALTSTTLDRAPQLKNNPSKTIFIDDFASKFSENEDIERAIRESLIDIPNADTDLIRNTKIENDMQQIIDTIYNKNKLISILSKLEGVNPYDPIFQGFMS